MSKQDLKRAKDEGLQQILGNRVKSDCFHQIIDFCLKFNSIIIYFRYKWTQKQNKLENIP